MKNPLSYQSLTLFKMRWLLFLPIGLSAQYYTPHLLGVAYTQAALLHEPLNANPASAFPQKRLALTAETATFLPATEIQFYSGGFAFSWDSLQSLSSLLQQWGFDKITQTEIGLGYAARFFQRRLTLAVRGRLLSTNFSEYGRLRQGTTDIGFTFRIGQHLFLGGYGYNLLARGWGFLPGHIQYGIGLAYVPVPTAQILTEITHQAYAPEVHTAFVYNPHDLLVLRGGISLPVLRVGAGLSLRYKSISLDIGYAYQPATGSWASAGLSLP